MTVLATIRGYASVFNRIFHPHPSGAMLITPAAFDLLRSVPVCVDHDESWTFGNSTDRHVRLWQDNYGLAFEIDVETPELERLARDVANGMDSVSVGFGDNRHSSYEMIAGELVEVVARTSLREFSILHNGACPDAHCWLSVHGQDRAPWDIRMLSARWNLGRQTLIMDAWKATKTPQSNISANPRPKIRKKPSAPPSLVELLNSGQMERFQMAQGRFRGLPSGSAEFSAVRSAEKKAPLGTPKIGVR